MPSTTPKINGDDGGGDGKLDGGRQALEDQLADGLLQPVGDAELALQGIDDEIANWT
jgi:hypothetical protein